MWTTDRSKNLFVSDRSSDPEHVYCELDEMGEIVDHSRWQPDVGHLFLFLVIPQPVMQKLAEAAMVYEEGVIDEIDSAFPISTDQDHPDH